MRWLKLRRSFEKAFRPLLQIQPPFDLPA